MSNRLPKLHNIHLLKQHQNFNKVSSGIAIGLFAVVGTVLLFRSHAATPFASIEPEQGIKTTNAVTVSDQTASGGSAIRFQAATNTAPDTSKRNCVVTPSSCGYPDATNTGVPTGQTLTNVPSQATSGQGWHWDSRGWLAADQAGAIINGIKVLAPIMVTADNVTIKNSYIASSGCGNYWNIRVTGQAKNTLIDHVTLTSDESVGAPGSSIGVDWDSPGVVISYANVSHYGNGVQNSDGPITVKESYFHDPSHNVCTAEEYHHEAFQSSGGGNVTLTHNTLINNFGQTTGVMLIVDPSGGNQTNDLIDNNLIMAGQYDLYAGAIGAGCASPCTTSNIRILNNRFSRAYSTVDNPFIAAVTYYISTDPGNQFSGNFWDDTGLPVN